MKKRYPLPKSLRKLFLKHTLSEILQPLVDKVPKFKSYRNYEKWVNKYFPSGSWATASIASLSKWKQGYKTSCPLCCENKGCSNCPLERVAAGACGARWLEAIDRYGDKQPLIHALELASVYAVVDELRMKCEETVRELTNA